MPRVVKKRVADSDRAKRPDFSIPNAADRQRGAVLHHEEALRHQHQAARDSDSGQPEKHSHHTLLTSAHQQQAEEHAKEAAKAHPGNGRHDSLDLQESPTTSRRGLEPTDMTKTARNPNRNKQDSHQKAAEFHDLAAHTHQVGAERRGKENHLTGHEHSRQALEHSHEVFQESLQRNAAQEQDIRQALEHSQQDDRQSFELHEATAQKISALAYELWQARGCPDGSPQEDWSCAEERLRLTAKG